MNTEYPIKYNMDGMYFRVERNGKFENICLSDMTNEERLKKMDWWNTDNMKSVINFLCETLREIGDTYGFIASDPERMNEVSHEEDPYIVQKRIRES